MTIHFAAARDTARSPMARAMVRRAIGKAANDNPSEVSEASDVMLHAALRHFAKYGIRAAHEARKEAEKAFFAEDRQRYDWWLGICRTLDRRLAEHFAQTISDLPAKDG